MHRYLRYALHFALSFGAFAATYWGSDYLWRKDFALWEAAGPLPDISKVDTLLRLGADPNAVHNEMSALHAAAIWDHPAAARMLLAHGADLTTTTSVRSPRSAPATALDLACYRGHVAMARVLVEAGAELSLSIQRTWNDEPIPLICRSREDVGTYVRKRR